MITTVDGLKQEMCFPLPDTSFIAVLLYRNVELIQLKVDNNPFASAYRQKNTLLPSTSDASGSKGGHVASGSNTIAAPPLQPLFTVGNQVNHDRSMMTYHQQLINHIRALAAPQRKKNTP